MNTDPTQDAHSLGIALRLAHAQNRELRKQLAASTSNGSLKFQDGICHDCESPDLCIQDNGCHNTGKIFSRIDRPTCEKADSTSETPRTDAVTTGSTGDLDFIYDLTFLCRQLERELAQAIKDRDEAKDGWGKELENSHRQHIHAEKLYNKAQQQLATATEALDEADDELRFAEDTVKGREGDAITKARGILQQALAAIKPNQGEHP